MKADVRFRWEGATFWAYVRTVTEALGASVRGSGTVRAFTLADVHEAMQRLGRSTDALGSVERPRACLAM